MSQTKILSREDQIGGAISLNDEDTEIGYSLNQPSGGWAASAIEPPNLARGSVFATTARLAARMNASTISESERKSLLRERQRLLDKLFMGNITKSERNKLEYVRWSLDKIEDAMQGAPLDALEAQVDAYENLTAEMTRFYNQLESKSQRRAR